MRHLPAIMLVVLSCAGSAISQPVLSPDATATNSPSLFFSEEDGWFDVSEFLDQKYGFLPIAFPITEPAVGYGVAAGLTFISKPLSGAKDGFGRPDITAVGGVGTENGTRGLMAGDIRYWMKDRLQTVAAVLDTSVNLDYYGLSPDSQWADHPLRYTLEPQGGMAQAKYRLGESRAWAGLNYVFTSTQVSFETPDEGEVIPDYDSESNVGGVTPSWTFDARDNVFTPSRGTYIEATAGLFSKALGSDDDFQRLRLIAMQYIPLHKRLNLGLRGEAASSFGDVPFYLRPMIALRGVSMMRYQGESAAQAEAELRWQIWRRFSLIAFGGCGSSWSDYERYESSQSVVAGGTGFRYELARKHGIHMGVDFAFGPDDPAIYLQVGSAWARP